MTAPLFAQGARGPIMGGGIISPPASQRPPGLQFVGIEQRLNAEVPGDLQFRDELGNPVKLGDYFGHGRPVILNLGYYQCPMLCSELLQGLVGSMKALTFDLGKDFDLDCDCANLLFPHCLPPESGPFLSTRHGSRIRW